MRYYARVGEREFVVDIEENAVLVDGEPVDVNIAQSGARELFSVLFDGKSHELLMETRRHDYTVTLRDEQYVVQVEDERTRRLSANRKLALPQGDISVVAPIPGLIVSVLVQEGDAIIENQPLLLLEAMKMENELRAVRPGKVRQIKVSAGQRVEQNAVLLILE
jgi:biotin carboxyl carrier protein